MTTHADHHHAGRGEDAESRIAQKEQRERAEFQHELEPGMKRLPRGLGLAPRSQAGPREQLERARPVGERERAILGQAMLLGRRHLAEAPVMAVGDEDGIVSETRRPARREHEVAVDAALESLDMTVRPAQRERADEIGRARASARRALPARPRSAPSRAEIAALPAQRAE